MLESPQGAAVGLSVSMWVGVEMRSDPMLSGSTRASAGVSVRDMGGSVGK